MGNLLSQIDQKWPIKNNNFRPSKLISIITTSRIVSIKISFNNIIVFEHRLTVVIFLPCFIIPMGQLIGRKCQKLQYLLVFANIQTGFVTTTHSISLFNVSIAVYKKAFDTRHARRSVSHTSTFPIITKIQIIGCIIIQ